MNLKFDSKQFGTTLFIIYLILIVPLIILLIKTGSDLNKLAMNPGFIIADQIREDYPKLFFLICFSFLIGFIAILSFIFYIKRNKSSIDFDETIDLEYWKELDDKTATKRNSFKEENHNIYQGQIEELKKEILKTNNKTSTNAKAEIAIQHICKAVKAGVGAIYLTNNVNEGDFLQFSSGYAFFKPKDQSGEILFGEGLTGQVAKTQKQIIIENLNSDQITIFSGLGKSSPRSIIITPILLHGKTIGIIEIASFQKLKSIEKQFITEAAEFLASEF